MAPKMLYKQPTELVGCIVLLWVAARLEMVAKTTSRRTHALFAHDHQYTLLFLPSTSKPSSWSYFHAVSIPICLGNPGSRMLLRRRVSRTHRQNEPEFMFGLPFTTAILMDVITSCFVKLLMHARCRSTPVLRYQSCSLSGKLMIKPPESWHSL